MSTEIRPKSLGPPGDTTEIGDVCVWRAWGAIVRWPSSFMLPEPRPAESLEDLADLEAAHRALAEPGAPVPYEEVRRELGLA